MDYFCLLSRSSHDLITPVSWAVSLFILVYFFVEATSILRPGQRQLKHIPFGSDNALMPKFIHNFIFASRATSMLQKAHSKFKGSAFKLIRNDGNIVILPLSLLEELASLPTAVASSQAALEHDLLGRYTGLDLILENRLHHSIVQRKLTPRLPLMVPRMEKAVSDAIESNLPLAARDEWVEFEPYQVLGRVSARAAAEVIVGPAFCENPVWLDISFNYTENLFKTIVIMRLLPGWMQPLVYFVLPSYWECQRYLNMSKALLGPRIGELIGKSDAGIWEPVDDDSSDLNILNWLSSMAKGRDRNSDTISHVLVLVALASVHTTLLRMVNVLYGITAAGPDLRKELLEEIATVAAAGWNANSYDQLHRLDSVLCESQRVSPPTTLGMKRLFREPYTFQDGTHIPANTYVCVPIHAIENDAAHTFDPEKFDGLRNFRGRKEQGHDNNLNTLSSKEYLFSTPTRTRLNFGYGKAACPGRFFASCVIKMVLVKMLTEYEFSFMPNTGRPTNLMVHEFLFPWPWQKMLVRRRGETCAPF